jgi:ribosomal protein L11 methyltransferase
LDLPAAGKQSNNIRMDYIGVRFIFKTGEVENDILIALLGELEYESFEEFDDGLLAYIQKPLFNEDSLKTMVRDVMHCVSTTHRSTDKMHRVSTMDIEYTFETIKDQNWNEVWESNYPAVTIGGDCYVRAPFHESNTEVEYEIIIEPQMSFGTAHHETTSMILEYILKHDFENESVLDMGSGTGVLAILAAMKGAKILEAIDVDEWAYRNCIENVKRNGFPEIKVIQGNADDLKNKKFSVIFANINRNILLEDMKSYVEAMEDKARIYFSGFYEEDLILIKQKAKELGLQFIDNKMKNRWIAAYFEK